MIKMSSASRTGYPGFFLTFLKRGTCPILLSLFVVSPGWNGGNGCCCWSRSGLSGSDIEQDTRLTPWYTLTRVTDTCLCSYILFGYGSKKIKKTGMDRSAVIPTCGRNELRIGGLIRTYCEGRYTKLAGYKYNLSFLDLDQEYGSGLRIACGSSIGALHGLSSVLRIPLVFCGSTFDLCSQGTMWWCCKAFCAMGGFLFRDWHFHTFRCDRINSKWGNIGNFLIPLTNVIEFIEFKFIVILVSIPILGSIPIQLWACCKGHEQLMLHHPQIGRMSRVKICLLLLGRYRYELVLAVRLNTVHGNGQTCNK